MVSTLFQAASPACTELEVIVLDWMGKLFLIQDLCMNVCNQTLIWLHMQQSNIKMTIGVASITQSPHVRK